MSDFWEIYNETKDRWMKIYYRYNLGELAMIIPVLESIDMRKCFEVLKSIAKLTNEEKAEG